MIQTQTIAQLKVVPNETLWQFLSHIWTSTEMTIFYGLMIGCCLGIVVHYLRQWASGQISGSLWAYLFVDYPRNTVLAIIGAAMVSAGETSASLYQGDAGEVFSWALVIISGFKNGYATDSLINKAKRSEWSAEERKARGAAADIAPTAAEPQKTP